MQPHAPSDKDIPKENTVSFEPKQGKLAINEQTFRLLAQNIPGTIYLCHNDEHFTMIYLNDHIETITGYGPQDFISGKITFQALLHPDDREHVHRTINNAIAERRNFHLRYRLRHVSGAWRWVDENGVGVFDGDQLLMLEGFLQDVTAQKEAGEAERLTFLHLQEQNRKLDEFAHIISHNLRAPVNNIQALINLLNDNSQIDDYKLIYEKLKKVARNLGDTMNELMDTLKARTQTHTDLTEIRFKEVLDKVVQSLEGELIMAGADVTYDFNEAPALRYSKPHLESIFQNLLTNAIKYRSPARKPVIHLKSSMSGESTVLRVSDNGSGIDMKKFGDEVFGLHKTFHENSEARGVGLFLVKSQIEALGGTISIESEVDKGTTFTIRFD